MRVEGARSQSCSPHIKVDIAIASLRYVTSRLPCSRRSNIFLLPTRGADNYPTSNFPSSAPNLFEGDSQWALLGCYNELDANAFPLALGTTGSYFTPPLAIPDTLTVPLCLDGCGAALGPSGGGPYIYACVENSQYVPYVLKATSTILSFYVTPN
jgi:hypothetical protein